MKMKPFLLAGLLALAGTLAAPAVQAHITLATRQAPAGSGYLAVLRVPHGCDGSDTIGLSIRIPDGVLEVKPQPKPGWGIEIQQGTYDHPQTLHGAKVSKGVREISWTGGDLPDAYYDEFVFHALIAPSLKAGSTLYFPVVQRCRNGVTRWIDTSGGDSEDSHPAPHLKVTASSAK